MNHTVVSSSSQRINAIDCLRGLVMIIMALDHVRDYFYYLPIDPGNLEQTTPALFFTRWITHFCAPVFVFLAGTSAFLSGKRRTKRELSWLLITRGLWLIVLELTVVLFGWTFNFTYSFVTLQVIWVIGLSMIALAGLIYLPMFVLMAFSIIVVFGHNMLDGIDSSHFGSYAWLWYLLHEREGFQLGNHIILIIYPLLPWVGVMTAGYCFGMIYQLPHLNRVVYLWWIGLGLTTVFIALRWINLYGEPSLWSQQETTLFTIMSFLNCSKYPPSLLYLLMTLGPSILLLVFLEKYPHAVLKPVMVFGQVPLFYYILHIYLLHGFALILAFIQTGSFLWMMDFFFIAMESGQTYGLNLFGTCMVWIIVVLTLYPICAWYAKIKIQKKNTWLRFL